MKVKNNFVSAVTLGNFNPSILTPDFLVKECKFELPEKPRYESTPVVSVIEYDRLSFTAELERFQIIEKGVDKFHDTPVVYYMEEYLRKLPHTPIFVCGVNLNIDVTVEEAESVIKLFLDKDILLKLIDSEKAVVESRMAYKLGSKEEHLGYYIAFPVKEPDIFCRLSVKIRECVFNTNYNYEVRGLEKDKSMLDKITKEYSAILGKYDNVINNIFGGVR